LGKNQNLASPKVFDLLRLCPTPLPATTVTKAAITHNKIIESIASLQQKRSLPFVIVTMTLQHFIAGDLCNETNKLVYNELIVCDRSLKAGCSAFQCRFE